MVYVLTIFLQNVKIQYRVVLKVCKYFFSQDPVFLRHQLTFGKTRVVTGSLVIMAEFATLRYQKSRTGMDNHNNKLSNSCKENPKLGHKHRYV